MRTVNQATVSALEDSVATKTTAADVKLLISDSLTAVYRPFEVNLFSRWNNDGYKDLYNVPGASLIDTSEVSFGEIDVDKVWNDSSYTDSIQIQIKFDQGDIIWDTDSAIVWWDYMRVEDNKEASIKDKI